MRSLLALILALLLGYASQVEAVARAEMAGATDLTICGASGAETLVLDATGHPVHPHGCTHCLAAAAVADLPAPLALAAPMGRVLRLRLAPGAASHRGQTLTPSARGPPAILA